VQVGLVAALFAAALVVLWTTGASVVARERRRSEAKTLLDLAGKDLATRGRAIIARAGEFPEFPEGQSRGDLDQELSIQAAAALDQHRDVDGGYFVKRFKRFFGTAHLHHPPTGKEADGKKQTPRPPAYPRDQPTLPPLEADLIDIQVDAAI